MKLSIYRSISCLVVVAAFFFVFLNAQVTPEVSKAQNDVNTILAESGRAFNEGLLAYQDRNLTEAGAKFNKAVEVFLYSGFKNDERMQECYNRLLDTIFLIEFPDARPPQIISLVQTCNWKNVSNETADKVVAIVQSSKVKQVSVASSTLAVGSAPVSGTPEGFVTQVFEPSPLDELSKLELNEDERQVESNPVASEQYQYLQYAVANRSLGFAFQVHPMIQQYINYYRGRGRTTMEVGLYRSGMFMLMARRIFKEEGIPENVAWLGQVESAWKPSAMSHMAASGLWQFIPGTGARYGLRRTAHIDERNSFDEATRASARYLKFLFNRYGNWELAIAGYNCGEGNVDKAIRRAGVSNFWAAYPYLPGETRNYVPNILATILIANNPGHYGFGHIRPAPPLRYDRVRIPASTNLSLIAQASDTTVQYLRYLNPHLRSNTTPPEPYVINVPPNKGDDVVAVFRRIPASKVNNTNLANSSSGETWQTISNRTGVSVADLMAANPGMPAPRGKVFVPVAGNNVQATSYSRPTGSGGVRTDGLRSVYANAGETVAKLADRFKADAVTVAKLNGLLPNSVLPKGREIKLPK